MKKCCENNNNNTNDGLSFDPCYKDRGYIIRLFIDSCSTTPIYPVTSLDAVTVKINTLDSDVKACLNSKIGNLTDKDEITLKELLESGCIIGSGEGSGEGGSDVYVKNVKLNNNHLIFTFENSNKTLDVDLSNFAPSASSDTYINEVSLDNTTLKLGYNSQTPELEVDLSNLIPSIIGNAYRIEVIDNGNNTTLNFVYDDLHIKEDKEILSITISDNKAIFSYWDDGEKKYNTITYSLSGDYQSVFIPGYYYSIRELSTGDEIDGTCEYIGTDLTEHVTFDKLFIYYAKTQSNFRLVERYRLPSKNYVYIVSTGATSTEAKDPNNNVPTQIYEPIGEIAYLKEDDGAVVLQAFEKSIESGSLYTNGNKHTNYSPSDNDRNIFNLEFTSPYLFGTDENETVNDPWKYLTITSASTHVYGDNLKNCPAYAETPTGENLKFVKMLNDECKIPYFKSGYTPDYDSDTFLRGDINGDGEVNGTDLNIMLNIVLGNDDPNNYDGRADVNGDGEVDGSDYNTLLNILNGTESSTPVETPLAIDSIEDLLVTLSSRYAHLWAIPVNNFTSNKINPSGGFYGSAHFDLRSNTIIETRFLDIYYDAPTSHIKKAVKKQSNISTYEWSDFANNDLNFNIYNYNTWSDITKSGYALSYILAFCFSSNKSLEGNSKYIYADFVNQFGWTNQWIKYNFNIMGSNIKLYGRTGTIEWDDTLGFCKMPGTWIFEINNGEFSITGKADITLGDYTWGTISGGNNNGKPYGYTVYNQGVGTKRSNFYWMMPKVTVNTLNAICTHLVTNNDTTTVESTYINLSNS